MTPKQKYYMYIVDKMIDDTRYTLSYGDEEDGEVPYGVVIHINLPMYAKKGYPSFAYSIEDVNNWHNDYSWNVGNFDREYLHDVFGASPDEYQVILNTFIKKLAKIILNE